MPSTWAALISPVSISGYKAALTKEIKDRGINMGSEHTFGWAIQQLKSGDKVSRSGWNGKGMWLHLQLPDENSKMTLPYIYMSTVDGKLVPWLASQTDILATDWGYPVIQETIPNTLTPEAMAKQGDIKA